MKVTVKEGGRKEYEIELDDTERECPFCLQAKEKTRFNCNGGSITAMDCPPFYDDEGVLHHHDMNRTQHSYRCQKGHQFSVYSSSSCKCGWTNGANVLVRDR